MRPIFVESLARIAPDTLVVYSTQWLAVLDQLWQTRPRVTGLHVHWQALWTNPARLYEYLLQRPFDAERHDQLRQMRIQPDFERVDIDSAHTQRMVRAIQSGEDNACRHDSSGRVACDGKAYS